MGLFSLDFNLSSKLANSILVRKIIKERIKNTPDTYNAGLKRMKNNKVKRVLESDVANYAIRKSAATIL